MAKEIGAVARAEQARVEALVDDLRRRREQRLDQRGLDARGHGGGKAHDGLRRGAEPRETREHEILHAVRHALRAMAQQFADEQRVAARRPRAARWRTASRRGRARSTAPADKGSSAQPRDEAGRQLAEQPAQRMRGRHLVVAPRQHQQSSARGRCGGPGISANRAWRRRPSARPRTRRPRAGGSAAALPARTRTARHARGPGCSNGLKATSAPRAMSCSGASGCGVSSAVAGAPPQRRRRRVAWPKAFNKVVLPMPASPLTSSTWPLPSTRRRELAIERQQGGVALDELHRLRPPAGGRAPPSPRRDRPARRPGRSRRRARRRTPRASAASAPTGAAVCGRKVDSRRLNSRSRPPSIARPSEQVVRQHRLSVCVATNQLPISQSIGVRRAAAAAGRRPSSRRRPASAAAVRRRRRRER